jgi:hypothetical protein
MCERCELVRSSSGLARPASVRAEVVVCGLPDVLSMTERPSVDVCSAVRAHRSPLRGVCRLGWTGVSVGQPHERALGLSYSPPDGVPGPHGHRMFGPHTAPDPSVVA